MWYSINNPVTKDILFRGAAIPDVVEEEFKYYNPISSRRDSITLTMQKFHNQGIKAQLISRVANAFRKGMRLYILDLCCGKGGDITKWRNVLQSRRGSKYVGIDKYADNIYNTKDGACSRYVSYQEKSKRFGKKLPPMDFIVGDVGDSIKSGLAFEHDSKDQKRFSFLWNGTKEFEEQIAPSPKFAVNQFNIVSCQFALHYFWSAEELFTGFMNNVVSNLKNGGFFIVTCFDGRTVFEALRDTPKGGFLKGELGGNILWKIKKDYDQETYPDGEDSFGMPITVFLPSISGKNKKGIQEWLVNTRYMISILSKEPYYLELLHKPRDNAIAKRINLPKVRGDDTEGFNKRGTGLFSRIYEEQSKKTNSFVLSPEERDISFLYRYMIFQKKDPTKRTISKRRKMKTVRIKKKKKTPDV